VTTLAHRLLLAAAALGSIAFPLARRGASSAVQSAALLVACALVGAAFSSDTPAFWPLAIFAAAMPWLPLPGKPKAPPALLLGAVLLATTAATHAIFFGEDRYHGVVTPVLALMAAAALRSR
jgi:hypothetical protein